MKTLLNILFNTLNIISRIFICWVRKRHSSEYYSGLGFCLYCDKKAKKK